MAVDLSGGRVEGIYVSARATELPRFVPAATAVEQKGLVGDRYFDQTGTWSNYPVETGRDLTLVPKQDGGPVNFLVYPYVEVDGKPYAADKIKKKFSYEDVK